MSTSLLPSPFPRQIAHPDSTSSLTSPLTASPSLPRSFEPTPVMTLGSILLSADPPSSSSVSTLSAVDTPPSTLAPLHRKHPSQPPSYQTHPQPQPSQPSHDHHLSPHGDPSTTLSSQSLSQSPPTTPGLPPVTYMANLIAHHLLQSGASMFGRRSDANCVLNVGEKRYYVHVQMLASRSPTFRRIFDDMIAHRAWGLSTNPPWQSIPDEDELTGQLQDDLDMDLYQDEDEDLLYDNVEDADEGEDGYDDYDDESMGDSDELEYPRPWLDPSLTTNIQPFADMPPTDTNTSMRRQIEGAYSRGQTSIEDLHIRLTNTLHVQDHREGIERMVDEAQEVDAENGAECDASNVLEESKQRHEEEEEGDNDEDMDDGLPKLSVSLADPEGSHFEELLYWLYTGDGDRWRRFFRPDNYQSILQNILHLNIVTQPVLQICLSFEASLEPDSPLRGRAMAYLCPSAIDPDLT